jgi:regulator of replication initiation timing
MKDTFHLKIIGGMTMYNYDEDYDFEVEQLYQQSLTIVRIIEENRRLKAQNASLRKRLQERDQFIDDQYNQTISQVGNILSILIRKEEQTK